LKHHPHFISGITSQQRFSSTRKISTRTTESKRRFENRARRRSSRENLSGPRVSVLLLYATATFHFGAKFSCVRGRVERTRPQTKRARARAVSKSPLTEISHVHRN
jgi:hypothetical protein